ncbi:tyrosine--tRNA ligase [Candidatus Nomurabacteria bacterium]|nr:tyrosine--tRNA ligase [Candidatus Nomurabacteria bacterium]
MEINTDPKKIQELLNRGVDEVIGREELEKALTSGVPLRVKFGTDPTSPNLHLGRAVQLLKLRDFQELGHTIVLIVGDFTAVIGDTSDKDAERPMLTHETIKKNLETYKEQIGKLLDMEKTEFRFNSEWLKDLDYNQIGEHADIFSVNQFIQRDNIRRRLEEGRRVSLREVLYPIMQGYDSVAIKADVELGGTDQRFNLLAGRTMQEYFGQRPQSIVMGPLVEGLDGRKMSSSWGNTVNLMDSPENMFGKIMSMKDEFIIKYFVLMTRVPLSEITELQYQLDQGTNPKDIKMRLAREIVTMYHSAGAATEAEKGWQEAFEKGGIPDNTKTIQVKIKMPLVDILMKEGLVKSRTEFRRLVESGAIKIYGKLEEKKLIDPESLAREDCSLKIGKKRFLKIKVVKEAQEEKPHN